MSNSDGPLSTSLVTDAEERNVIMTQECVLTSDVPAEVWAGRSARLEDILTTKIGCICNFNLILRIFAFCLML